MGVENAERKEANGRRGKKMRIGYVRVSTEEQNTARQEALMESLGVEKVYIDKASGKNAERAALKSMMEYVREGDVVVVSEISRFARNTRDLLELIEQLRAKGAQFESQKERIDTTTPTGKFMLTVFGAVAELERGYILERQREGIEIAKGQGKYRGRQEIPVDPVKFAEVYKRWKAGEITAVKARETLGLKHNKWYYSVQRYEEFGDPNRVR